MIPDGGQEMLEQMEWSERLFSACKEVERGVNNCSPGVQQTTHNMGM